MSASHGIELINIDGFIWVFISAESFPSRIEDLRRRSPAYGKGISNTSFISFVEYQDLVSSFGSFSSSHINPRLP
jgi:hypothetical protein